MGARQWSVVILLMLIICGWALPRTGAAAPAPLAPLTQHDRLLVIAPHPDDETVGCGGLIQQVVAAGAAVRVVYLTNGDGFRVGAERLYGRTVLTPEDYLRMGARRQREAIAALAALGVGEKQIVFLGYPDGGTAALWLEHWGPEQRFTSARTKLDHVPAGSFHFGKQYGAPYCGRSLLDDLKSVIAQFHPTVVAMPHGGDRHPDHWAAYCYGIAALYELGRLGRVRVLTYLIHENGYPEVDRKTGAVPPPAQPEAWRALTLTAKQRAVKAQAIACYQTQTPVLGDFLRKFAGPEEWFAEAPVEKPGPVAVRDPAERALPPAADMLSVSAGRAAAVLGVRVELAGAPVSDVTYEVYLHPLRGGRSKSVTRPGRPTGSPLLVGPPARYVITPGGATRGVTARAKGDWIEAEVPLGTDDTGAMLAVATWQDGKQLDRSAWLLTISLPY